MLLLRPGVELTGAGLVKVRRPEVVQHEAVKPLGPRHLPLDHPDTRYTRGPHISHFLKTMKVEKKDDKSYLFLTLTHPGHCTGPIRRR